MNIKGIITTGLLCLVATGAQADTRNDYSARATELRGNVLPTNAVDLSMGGANTQTSTQATALLLNPAGLAGVSAPTAHVGYAYTQFTGTDVAGTLSKDVDTYGTQGTVIGALPVEGLGTVGYGWTGTDADINNIQDSNVRGYGLHLGLGRKINDALSLGYSVSYEAQSLRASNSVAFDPANVSLSPAAIYPRSYKSNDTIRQALGATYALDKKTTLGASTNYTFGSYDAKFNAPLESANFDSAFNNWQIAAGASHQYNDKLSVAFSAQYARWGGSSLNGYSNRWQYGLGTSYKLDNMFTARAGYRYANWFGPSTDHGFSLGLGANVMDNIELNYGTEYRTIGSGEWSHLVSLNIPFNNCK